MGLQIRDLGLLKRYYGMASFFGISHKCQKRMPSRKGRPINYPLNTNNGVSV